VQCRECECCDMSNVCVCVCVGCGSLWWCVECLYEYLLLSFVCSTVQFLTRQLLCSGCGVGRHLLRCVNDVSSRNESLEMAVVVAVARVQNHHALQ